MIRKCVGSTTRWDLSRCKTHFISRPEISIGRRTCTSESLAEKWLCSIHPPSDSGSAHRSYSLGRCETFLNLASSSSTTTSSPSISIDPYHRKDRKRTTIVGMPSLPSHESLRRRAWAIQTVSDIIKTRDDGWRLLKGLQPKTHGWRDRYRTTGRGGGAEGTWKDLSMAAV